MAEAIRGHGGFMDIKEIKVGMLVVMPKRPEWGPGKVLEIKGTRVLVFFRDVRKSSIDDAVKWLDLARGAVLEPAPVQSDPWLDNLPFRDGRLVLTRPPRTMAQAIESFLHQFPEGFKDPGYLGDRKSGERNYKCEAHEKYLQLLGNGEGQRLLAEGNLDEVISRAKQVWNRVNLMTSFEKAAMSDGLKDEAAAQNYFEALFAFIDATEPNRELFERLAAALEGLPAPGSRVACWPNMTTLPFLARPDVFMVLKHDVSHVAADLLAFDLQYDSQLNWTTYDRLMTLSRLLKQALMGQDEPALVPQDFIDVQSFMYVVASYGAPQKT